VLGRYKKQILHLTESLRRLEKDPDNLDILVALQQELVRRIKSAERRIKDLREDSYQLKAQLKEGRLPKDKANVLRKRKKVTNEDIDRYQYLIFIWRCFGDGIAFIYLSKFALKHVYYNVTDHTPKQDAGSLTGKEGLKLEWTCVKVLTSKGIPGMLCDVTNTIRHGDVCVLIGPDPILIEVKSSRNKNSRVIRQIESNKALMDFFETDEARNFRGLPHIKRSQFKLPEITHFDALNRCICESEGLPITTISPERGLHYICIRDEKGLDSIGSDVINRDSIFFTLNELKTSRNWMPYFPFTLSIRDPFHLYEFVQGQYTLSVIVDMTELVRQFSHLGIDAVITPNEDWAIWLRVRGEHGIGAVSKHSFSRILLECQSIAWFVSIQSGYQRDLAVDMAKQADGPGAPDVQNDFQLKVPESVQRLFDKSNSKD
jgi:hypothetical protein